MISALVLAIAQSIAPIGVERAAPGGGQESWSKIAVHQSGAIARAWTCSGPDVAFQVVGYASQIANTYTQGVQDEPILRSTPEGWLVAWDQRDPVYMHIAFRRFGVDGAALSGALQIDEQPTAWRPLIAVRGDGVVAFAWTGGWDNRSFVRLMDASGAWLTSSIEVGVNVNGDQENPAPCWLASGELLVVFTDYHGGALGLELMARRLSPSGAWLNLPERLVAAGVPGDQDWSVVEFDAATLTPWIAWYDSAGVWLQRGLGSTPTSLGSGRLPELAPPFVAFERAGDVQLVGVLGGTSIVANTGIAGVQQRPSLALAPSGGRLLVAWDGPSASSTTSDAFVRLFAVH